MKILIIDDDNYKVNQFTKHLTDEDEFIIKGSYNSGLRELLFNKDVIYDCILLDMNFPIFDGERVEIDEGLSVLSELKRRKIKIPVVIYSSKEVYVAHYENVINYILYEGFVLNSKIEEIKNKINN